MHLFFPAGLLSYMLIFHFLLFASLPIQEAAYVQVLNGS